MYKKGIKRLMDLIFSLILLLILLPIMIIVALLVKLTSRGPIFYKGKRTGYKGKTIYIYKFRSMVANADAVGGDLATGHDPRITKVGRFLRVFKLDEIPQLLNILKGEMSFIGPRPELVRCAEKFTGDELKIFNVRPGLTDFSSIYFVNMEEVVGSAEIAANYENSILRVKNKLRIKYVNEISFFTDLKILFMTGFAILGKILRITKYKYPRANGKPSIIIHSTSLDYIYLNHLSLIEKLIKNEFEVIIVAPFNDNKDELLSMGCKLVNVKYKKKITGIACKINNSILPEFVISYGNLANITSGKAAIKGKYKSIINISDNDYLFLNEKLIHNYKKIAKRVNYTYSSTEEVINKINLPKNKITIINNSDELIYNMINPQPIPQETVAG